MKAFLYSSILVLGFFLAPGVLHAQELDFSGIEWGMSANDVVALKGSGIVEKGDVYLSYWERFLGKRFRTYYFFDDEGLSQFELHFKDKIGDPETYLEFMYLLRDEFSAQYGAADDYKTVLAMDNIDPGDLEKGVREGKIRFVYWWYKETFTAELRMGKLLETPPPLALIISRAERQGT